MTVKSRTFRSDTQRQRVRGSRSNTRLLACPASRTEPHGHLCPEGSPSSGVAEWLGALLSFAQSDYQFGIQMNSSFLPSCGERLPGPAPAPRVAPAWQESGEEPDTLSTKEKVLWVQGEAAGTGAAAGMAGCLARAAGPPGSTHPSPLSFGLC